MIATARLDRVENVAVRLTLAGGSVGWGEIATLHPVTAERYDDALAAVVAADQALRGSSVEAADLAARLLDLGLGGASRSGIEQAFWDASARAAGVPLYRWVAGDPTWDLRGPPPSPVVTDITVPICAPGRAAALAVRYRDRGFTTLKVKVGLEPAEDIARVAAIVEAHPAAALVLDANEGWTVDHTLEIVATLRAGGAQIVMLEQPIPRDDLDGLARLTREAGTLVAADEACRSVQDVSRIGRDRLASAINVKIAKCGVQEAIAMIHEARRHDLATMIGAMVETRLGTGFSAHVAAGLGGFAVIDLDTSVLLASDPVVGGPSLTGPRWHIDPTVAGHGCARAADV